MAKVTAQNIIDLGITPEMFGKTSGNFNAFIDLVISEQSKIFEGRVGSSLYATVTSPAKEYVLRGEQCLVAAEMFQRRINRILSNVVGTNLEVNTAFENTQRNLYLEEAEKLITKIVSNITTDSESFSSEVIETKHF